MNGPDQFTLDANVLFYALDPDAGEKHVIAQRLVAAAGRRSAVLALQALGELCNSVRRKRPRSLPVAHRFAQSSLEIFQVTGATPADLTDALRAHQDHNLQFWDAMLWATVRRAGCTLLLTEDMQATRILGGVTLQNPFVLSSKALDSMIGLL